LLAASITGVKFATASSSGFTPGVDVPMANVTIDLFDHATHTLLRQVLTNAQGQYAFNNVADGVYDIEEDPTSLPPGFTQSAGPAFYTVDVINSLVYTISPAANPEQTLNVDSFAVPNPDQIYKILASNPNPTFLPSGLSPTILGGQRDLEIHVLTQQVGL